MHFSMAGCSRVPLQPSGTRWPQADSHTCAHLRYQRMCDTLQLQLLVCPSQDMVEAIPVVCMAN